MVRAKICTASFSNYSGLGHHQSWFLYDSRCQGKCSSFKGVFPVYFLVYCLCWASYKPVFLDWQYKAIKLKEKAWHMHLTFAIELCFTSSMLVEINTTFNIIGNILHDQKSFWLACMHKIKSSAHINGDNGLQRKKFLTGPFSYREIVLVRNWREYIKPWGRFYILLLGKA